MHCNPDLQNPHDCEEQTQIQAFIRVIFISVPSSESSDRKQQSPRWLMPKSIEAQEAKLNRTLHSNSCAHDMTVPPPFWTDNYTKTP